MLEVQSVEGQDGGILKRLVVVSVNGRGTLRIEKLAKQDCETEVIVTNSADGGVFEKAIQEFREVAVSRFHHVEDGPFCWIARADGNNELVDCADESLVDKLLSSVRKAAKSSANR